MREGGGIPVDCAQSNFSSLFCCLFACRSERLVMYKDIPSRYGILTPQNFEDGKKNVSKSIQLCQFPFLNEPVAGVKNVH